VHGAVKSARYIGGKFSFSEHTPLIVYHSYRNLRTPDIDRSDHARHLPYFLMAMRSKIVNAFIKSNEYSGIADFDVKRKSPLSRHLRFIRSEYWALPLP